MLAERDDLETGKGLGGNEYLEEMEELVKFFHGKMSHLDWSSPDYLETLAGDAGTRHNMVAEQH